MSILYQGRPDWMGMPLGWSIRVHVVVAQEKEAGIK